MKYLLVVAIFVAFTQAIEVFNSFEKLIPSFPSGFVIKGEDATPHAAPYIVSVSRNNLMSHICGGTIIAKDWILTAGHCINDPVGMVIVAGLHERKNYDENTQTRVIDWGKVHEKYDGEVGPYDIGILHLSQPLELNRYVQIAALPQRGEIHSGVAHLYGWGQSKSYTSTVAATLQTVETEILEYDDCKASLLPNANIHETNLCSSSKRQGISACNGDSGGPLVIEYENAPAELIGIVSWVYIPCGVLQLPSIYTRVSAYLDWIVMIQNAYYILH